MGIVGVSGYAPVHAARESAVTDAAHFGSADMNFDGSKPAAANSAAQSGAGQGPLDSSNSGGTALKPINRPCGSNVTYNMPGKSCGGSSGVTDGISEISRGARGDGLDRYQNAMVGGRPWFSVAKPAFFKLRIK